MATTAAAIDQAANPKSVDESLWWDSFVDLLNELENVCSSSSLSSTIVIPSSLVKKLKNNHSWFLGTVSLFKPPNHNSKAALDSNQLNVGSHTLISQPELKDLALQLSLTAGLDEVQSYILVKRFVENGNVAADINVQSHLHLVLLQYYIERQCLLKCTRQIIMHACYSDMLKVFEEKEMRNHMPHEDIFFRPKANENIIISMHSRVNSFLVKENLKVSSSNGRRNDA
ncbi:nucleoporin [Thalictrum thalictroides]|uniref:Nucleoporin n=1 Tax=Thalictrum thalictroides TaxID=46969 RepID=A0A7J6X437_THATH|nr:nucleoporin [Thalictrum thalictroides]